MLDVLPDFSSAGGKDSDRGDDRHWWTAGQLFPTGNVG